MFLKLIKKDTQLLELIKGSGAALILKILAMALGYISMLLITNFYGASVFGVLSLGVSVISLLSIIPKFGFDNFIVRIVGEYKINNREGLGEVFYGTFFISTVISIIISLLCYFNSGFISDTLLNNPNFESSLKYCSFFIFPFTVLAIIYAFFQAYKKTILYIALQTTFIQLFFLISLIIVTLFNIKFNIVFLYGLAISLTVLLGLGLMFFKYKGTVGTAQLSYIKNLHSLKNIIKKSSPMLFASSFALILTWADTIMLSIFSSNSDIGIYNVAQRIATLIGVSLIAVNSIAAPKFVENYVQDDIIGLKKIVQKSTLMIFIMSLPIFFIYVIVPKFVLSFFGDEFTTSSSITVLVILSIGQLINAFSGSVGYIMQMTDNEKKFQNTILIAALLNLALNLILIPISGVIGAAIASLISMVFWNLKLVLFIRRKFGFWTIFGI